MSQQRNPPRIPLPRDWPRRVKSAMVHVISLAQCTGTPETAVFVPDKIFGTHRY